VDWTRASLGIVSAAVSAIAASCAPRSAAVPAGIDKVDPMLPDSISVSSEPGAQELSFPISIARHEVLPVNERRTKQEMTTDDIIDALAAIELQRQELHAQADPEGWRRLALAELEEMRRQLEEELRLHGPSAERSAAAQAVRIEISRVKGSAGATNRDPRSRAPGRRPAPQRRDGRRPSRADTGGRPTRRRGGH